MKNVIYSLVVAVMAVVLIVAVAVILPMISTSVTSDAIATSGTATIKTVDNEAVQPDGGHAERCYLTEATTGMVLYKKNEDERHEIASMVKIMTLLLTFEAIEKNEASYDELITISREAAAEKGSELFLDAGAQYRLSDLIKGITVVSANDASVAVAERLAGSVPAFVDRMNARAQELGMTNTKFVNATGYPSENEQYSTARDVNAMTRELIKHKDYYNYSRIWVEDFTHPSGRITGLANTNKLVRFYKGCDSGKTGYTSTAKFCLSASAERNGLRVVGTVIGAESSDNRFSAMRKMFDYSFMNYKAECVKECGSNADIEISVKKGKEDSITPIFSADLKFITSRAGGEYTVEYETQEIIAPMSKGSVVGKAKLMSGDKVVSEVNLILDRDVEKASFFDYIRKICR